MSRELSSRKRISLMANGSQESKKQSADRTLIEKTNCLQVSPNKSSGSCGPPHLLSHNPSPGLSIEAALDSKKASNETDENSEVYNKPPPKTHG